MDRPREPMAYPRNLLDDIAKKTNGKHLTDLPYDYYLSIEYAISLLTEREAGVLNLRYKQGMKLDDVGKVYGVSRERIRQILYKALRKLKHPSKWRFIEYGISMAMKTAEDKAREEGFQIGYRKGLIDAKYDRKPGSLCDVSLEDLDLSVRSFNCLYRAGVRTGSDIVGMGFEKLIRVRNLGMKSYEEIIKKLDAHGYDTTNLMPPKDGGDNHENHVR